jgi:hypothetical protein
MLEERILKINEALAEHGSDYSKSMIWKHSSRPCRRSADRSRRPWLELAEIVPEN